MRSTRTPLAFTVMILATQVGCDDTISSDTSDQVLHKAARDDLRSDSTELIDYRGRLMPAVRNGDGWVIEGDILVAESDLGADPALTGHEKANREFSATRNLKWPSNTIYYRFGDLLATGQCTSGGVAVNCNTRLTQAGYEQAIREAMNDWEAVSNLRFVRDSSNAQADYLAITGTNDRCSSHMGRIGGGQLFEWSDRCSFFPDGRKRFSTHHELGHAMGLWHEHQRSDRGTYVDVLNGVETSDALNYAMGGARVNAYDCDSVMHYGINLAAKTDASGTSLCPNMGQRDHLSVGDIAAASVLYPSMYRHFFVFANTGSQQVCRLAGREADANTTFEAWVDGASATAPRIGTNVTQGDHTLRCRAQSCFWRNSYLYPATTVTAPGNSCGGNAEVFEQTGSLRVANAGLIAVLFGL